MRALLLVIVLAASAGCLRKTEFKCDMAADCGDSGTCEPTQFCSFPDTMCPEGRRYGELSGTYSNQCVGDGPGVDGGMGDGPTGDGPDGCPQSYAALPNVATHRYRVISAGAPWMAQRSACAADGTNAYLAIPDDMAELTALVTAANAARSWVGIDDQAAENTYATVRGGTISAADPMWDQNEPDNQPFSGGGQADCVVALMNNAQLADDRCGEPYPAVCECEP